MGEDEEKEKKDERWERERERERAARERERAARERAALRCAIVGERRAWLREREKAALRRARFTLLPCSLVARSNAPRKALCLNKPTSRTNSMRRTFVSLNRPFNFSTGKASAPEVLVDLQLVPSNPIQCGLAL